MANRNKKRNKVKYTRSAVDAPKATYGEKGIPEEYRERNNDYGMEGTEIGRGAVTVGVGAAKVGRKAGKAYAYDLPKKIVNLTEAQLATTEPDYKGWERNIDWGLGVGGKAVKGITRTKTAQGISGRTKGFFSKGTQAASSIDTRVSSIGSRYAPDQYVRKTKIGKFFGGAARDAERTKVGKFIGSSAAGAKYREAKDKLAFARQHKAATGFKIGKAGAKGTAKLALANANMAAEFISKQDGILAVLKPVFWSLKLVPFLTSAIVPILITAIAALIALMIFVCGWVSLGYLLYFLKTIPGFIWNIFATFGNALYFGFHAVTQLLLMGITDIINGIAYFFVGPIIDGLNTVTLGTMDLTFQPIGQVNWFATPGNAISYATPGPIRFNTDPNAGILYGMPTLESILAYTFIKPGTPMYATDSHGFYEWETIDTGNLVLLRFPKINEDARTDELFATLDNPPPPITDFFDVNQHWTFWSYLTGQVSGGAETVYNRVSGILDEFSERVTTRISTKWMALGDAASQGNNWGNKIAIYERNNLPWAFAPDNINERLDETHKYNVQGKGVCLIYNTNTLLGTILRHSVLSTVNIDNLDEGKGIFRPDYIFAGEPFYVDQDIMKSLKLGRFAEQGDSKSRLWDMHYKGAVWRDGNNGRLVETNIFDAWYLQQMQAMIELDYSGG